MVPRSTSQQPLLELITVIIPALSSALVPFVPPFPARSFANLIALRIDFFPFKRERDKESKIGCRECGREKVGVGVRGEGGQGEVRERGGQSR